MGTWKEERHRKGRKESGEGRMRKGKGGGRGEERNGIMKNCKSRLREKIAKEEGNKRKRHERQKRKIGRKEGEKKGGQKSMKEGPERNKQGEKKKLKG